MSASCLNCDTILQGKFCHQCGQKSETHRITFGSLIKHDLLHGIFHLDRGIIYTLRALIVSPGFAVKSFISGKRVMHYNIFALFIIIIAIKSFLDAHNSADMVWTSEVANEKDATTNAIMDNYYKVFYLLSIPLLSLCTFFLFRRLRYNFTEHIVLNCFLLTGGFFYTLLFSLFELVSSFESARVFGYVTLIIYLIIGLYQATKLDYKMLAFTWRVLAVILLFTLLVTSGFIIFLSSFYGGDFTGELSNI